MVSKWTSTRPLAMWRAVDVVMSARPCNVARACWACRMMVGGADSGAAGLIGIMLQIGGSFCARCYP